ncbi:uncharacterized protein LOC128964357 isoform X2 [Oppia nitens]|uniref:uncharacterized protein LOC128964357 isoform X2 n=1 Tax=Oppia nitens TaxID=1686743 RepID=UPI0023DBCBE9|nr:uncharacterized protein LOC128964357 isoform X2 [Oppia nitens]
MVSFVFVVFFLTFVRSDPLPCATCGKGKDKTSEESEFLPPLDPKIEFQDRKNNLNANSYFNSKNFNPIQSYSTGLGHFDHFDQSGESGHSGHSVWPLVVTKNVRLPPPASQSDGNSVDMKALPLVKENQIIFLENPFFE